MKALIDVLPVPSSKSIDQHIQKFMVDISVLPNDSPLFVDYYGFLPGQLSSSGRTAVLQGYRELYDAGRLVTPVYGFGRDETMWSDIATAVGAHGCGFCFRLEIEDLDEEAENTWANILMRTAELGLSAAEVDLYLDLRDVRNGDVDELQDIVTDFLALLPSGAEYRSICVAGSSASKDVTSIGRDTVGTIYRNELKLWARLLTDVPACADLVYGDYGIVHPDFADNIPCGGTVNCKIRYTAGDKIIVFRGHVRRGDALQTHALAANVVAHPAYRGPGFSDGDAYIDDCAAYRDGPGNPATWVFVDLNHHYVYVAQQIERLIGEMEIDATHEEIDVLLQEI
jgi:hypothetical protein